METTHPSRNRDVLTGACGSALQRCSQKGERHAPITSTFVELGGDRDMLSVMQPRDYGLLSGSSRACAEDAAVIYQWTEPMGVVHY